MRKSNSIFLLFIWICFHPNKNISMNSKNILLIAFILVLSTAMKFTSRYHVEHLASLDLTALRNAELKRHNQLRAKHGCPPLSLDPTLNQAAQAYSQKMLAQTYFGHSAEARSGRYGENLFWSWGSPTVKYTTAEASQSWYDEIVDYNYSTFKSNDPSKMVGHFTAMIWKSAKKVGFGYALGKEDGGYAIYVTANYSPVTNVIGRYAANVPRPL